MSFVDVMKNDVWSDADITVRTEEMLHSAVSKDDELILSRKMIGYSLGLLIPTSAEAAQLTAYQIAGYTAQTAGVASRADMALLHSTLIYEVAVSRLAQYQLSVGRPQQTLVVQTGNLILDPVTNLMIPETTTQIIPAIAPLPATVLYTDMAGVGTQVPNPAIVQDDSQHAAAQVIVTAAPATVLALALLRNR